MNDARRDEPDGEAVTKLRLSLTRRRGRANRASGNEQLLAIKLMRDKKRRGDFFAIR